MLQNQMLILVTQNLFRIFAINSLNKKENKLCIYETKTNYDRDSRSGPTCRNSGKV